MICYESDGENAADIWHYEGIHGKDRKCMKYQGYQAWQYPKFFNHVICPICWMDMVCVHICFVAEEKAVWMKFVK